MSKEERLARIYAAWLLIYSPVPAQAGAAFDENVSVVLDAILAGTGLEGHQIFKDWEDNVRLNGLGATNGVVHSTT